jgi:hypothetical protein
VKDLYKENYKLLKKEIEDDDKIDLPRSWIGESILWKWLYYQKQLPKVQCNSHQNFNDIYQRFKKSTLQFIWKHRPQVAKVIPSKNSNSGGYPNTWSQTILQNNSIKNSMVLAQKQIWRSVEQNRMNPLSYAHLISDKNTEWKKDRL